MSMIKLAVDPEFRDLLPKLTAQEREALEASIVNEGCRDPIVTWGSIIVDGHNRYDICSARGLPFTTVPFYGGTDFDYLPSMREKREAVKRWIIATQLSRRNMTDEQRTLYLGMLYESAKKAAGNPDAPNVKNRLNEVKNQMGQNVPFDNSAKNAVVPDRISAQIAKEHGVNERTVRRAGEFARGIDRIGKVSPEVRAKILSGESKSVVSMGQVRGLAGASEAQVKEAVRAVIDNKPLEKPEPATTSIAATEQGGKPSVGELRSCPPTTAEALGGGDHSKMVVRPEFNVGAKDVITAIDRILTNIRLDDLGGDDLIEYCDDIDRLRSIVADHRQDIETALCSRGLYHQSAIKEDKDTPAVERPEAVSWYADDFLSGVSDMTNEQAGAYAKLLSMQQSKGPLTKEQLNSVTSDKFVHKKFQYNADDGTYANPRMEKEVKARLAHQAAQRDRVNKRWNKGLVTDGNGGGKSDGAEDQSGYRGNTAVIPVLKDLKDKTKQDSQKDVNLVALPQIQKGVNVLSLGVKDETVGDSDSAGAGGREEDLFDQSAEIEFDQSAGAEGEFDQTGGQEVEAVVKKGASKAKRVDFTPPDHLADIWGDFLEMRRKLGKPATVRAMEGIIRELEKLAAGDKEKQHEILDQSIRNGYQDVWPLKIKDTKQTQGKPLTSGRTLYEFDRQSIESGKYKNILPKA